MYDEIVAAGGAFNLVHAGYHALNSCRMEKGYRHWSHDITDEDTPLEAGLEFTVKFDKPGGFIGREALLKQKDEGLKRQLVQLKLQDPEPLIYHNEPIWRDDELVGHITSGMFGHTLGASIGLGYVHLDERAATEGAYAVEVAGVRVPADVSLEPMYDPTNERIRR